jgi:2-C-methyl-D-erythritol 2,4-cyclodiphosphate synthase
LSSNPQMLRVPRVGFGWDSHEFKSGIPLKIGGILIPHDSGLVGHSDGDVLLHALTDAMLGAIAAGDIGTHFPPTDPKWRGANSVLFVREALKQIEEAGYIVGNVDTTLILAQPKISPHAKAIQQHVAELLSVDPLRVGVKAKTPEGLGIPNVAIAQVAVLLVEIWP